MQLAKRIWPGNAIARHLAVASFLGLLFAVLGPFGSYPALDLPMRYAFWIGLVLFGYFCALVTTIAIDRNVQAGRVHPAARLLGVTAASAIPTTFATAWAMSQMPSRSVVSLDELPGLFAAVACVQLVLAFVQLRLTDPAEAPPVAAGQSPARFLERIPVHLGHDLIAVEAVDHYLRVHTKAGSALVHMRIKDALDELQDADGLQVHRSWWVARGAVSSWKRNGARTILMLANGIEVPVSRTFLMAVRTANWPADRSAALLSF